MKPERWPFFLALLLLASLARPALADQALALGQRDKAELGPYLELLEDKEKQFTPADLTHPPLSQAFRPSPAAVPNLGLSAAAIWARFSLNNPESAALSLFLVFEYPITDKVTLFVPTPHGYKPLVAGAAVAEPQGTLPHRFFVFPLEIPAQSQATYLLRVESRTALSLPVTLWRPAAFHRQDRLNQLGLGLLFGATGGFIIYFLVAAVRLRSDSAAWFAVYLFALGGLVAIRTGFSRDLLGLALAPWTGLLLLAVHSLLYFSGAKFLRVFLNTARHSRPADRVVAVLQWLGLGYLPVALFPHPLLPAYSLVLFGLGPLVSSAIAIWFWARGVRQAKYFAIGWLIGHLTSTLDLLRVMGSLPYWPLLVAALPAALLSALLFFTFAVVHQLFTYRRFAHEDALTGLANRRFFAETFEREWNRHLRHQRDLTLIMVDVDFFKSFNDSHGHQAGDRGLVEVAEVLAKHSRRSGDLVARYGGEEFVILLAETSPDEALHLAERMRQAVEELNLPHPASSFGRLTVSVGVATATPDQSSNPYRLLREADQALYRAKKAGRNRTAQA